MRNWQDGPRWVKGVIVRALGPVQYQIQVEGSGTRRCHADHLLPRRRGSQSAHSAGVAEEEDGSYGDSDDTPNARETENKEAEEQEQLPITADEQSA